MKCEFVECSGYFKCEGATAVQSKAVVRRWQSVHLKSLLDSEGSEIR